MLKWKWVALALVTSTLWANAEESSKEKFLNNYGRMLAAEARCPSWKINPHCVHRTGSQTINNKQNE